MSRSGYVDCDDLDPLQYGRWMGNVSRSLKGKRGQKALMEIAKALDSLPEKELGAESLVTAEGQFCTLGALGRLRGIDIESVDPEDREQVAGLFDISVPMAAEIMFLNDESIPDGRYRCEEIVGPVRQFDSRYRNIFEPTVNVAHKRWAYMREWVASKILTH